MRSTPYALARWISLFNGSDGFISLPLGGRLAAFPQGHSDLTLSASRKPGDVFYDGKLDFKDYAIVASEFGKTGASVGDVAGPKGLGMPDGKVDYLDVQAILYAISGNTPIIQATKALDDSE